jgi:hypothetical protein
MQKLEPNFKFLNKPPEWFALLFWIYPVVWYFVAYPLMAIPQQAFPQRVIFYYLLVSFPLPLLFLLLTSNWFRKRILLMGFSGLWCQPSCSALPRAQSQPLLPESSAQYLLDQVNENNANRATNQAFV